jgi:hypothetical protein
MNDASQLQTLATQCADSSIHALRVIPFLNRYETRRDDADSAIARHGGATTCRIDLEVEKLTQGVFNMNTKANSMFGALLAAGILSISTFGDAHAGAKRGHVANAEGGTTAAAATKRTGANGGTRSAARGVKTDAAGNAAGGSAATTTTANGGTASRAAKFQRNADGSASRQSGYAASGAKGSASAQGSATKNVDGTVSANRSGTATSAATGNSVNTNASYQTGQGVTKSATCFDASGATIPCPTR